MVTKTDTENWLVRNIQTGQENRRFNLTKVDCTQQLVTEIQNRTDLPDCVRRTIDSIKTTSFQKLRECTWDTSNDDTSHKHNLGELILEMDKTTRVPGYGISSDSYPRQQSLNHKCHKHPAACTHCTTNRNIFSVAEAVANWVKCQISTQFHVDNHFQILATGSYIGETKVLENREFDFLLTFNTRSEQKKSEVGSIFSFYRYWFQSLQGRIGSSKSTEKPGIISVYEHGSAWCIEISWLKEGFDNRISIDITLAVRHLGIDMKTHCTYLQVNPIYRNNYYSLHEKALYLNPNKSDSTTCVFQGKMVAALNELSENILPVYRLLKVLVTILLPKRIKYSKHTARGYTESNFINSHKLMNSFLKYVDAHGTADQWEKDMLPHRVIELLQKLIKCKEFDPKGYVHDATQSMEVRTVEYMINYFKSEQYEKTNIDVSGIFAIIKESNYEKISSIEQFQQFLSDDGGDSEILVYFTHDLLFVNNEDHNRPAFGLLRQFQHYLYTELRSIPEISAGRSNLGRRPDTDPYHLFCNTDSSEGKL